MGMGASGNGPASEINVTPLVDVVLVLLIIFMVITPMLQAGQPVQVPKAPHAENKKDADDDLIITVAADQSIWVEDELVDQDALDSRLRAILAYEPFKQILVKGDQSLTWAPVRAVMETCSAAGAKSVAVMTDKNTPSQTGVAERNSGGGGAGS